MRETNFEGLGGDVHPPRRSPLLIPSTNDESTPVADPALDVCVPGAGGGGRRDGPISSLDFWFSFFKCPFYLLKEQNAEQMYVWAGR